MYFIKKDENNFHAKIRIQLNLLFYSFLLSRKPEIQRNNPKASFFDPPKSWPLVYGEVLANSFTKNQTPR